MQTQENPWAQFNWREVMKDMQEIGRNIRDEVLLKNRTNHLPAINIQEKPAHYQIDIFLAGYAKESLKLSWENFAMTIKALPTEAEQEANYIVQECSIQPIERTFDLPTDTEPERVTAKFENGVLCIILPKVLPTQTEVSIG